MPDIGVPSGRAAWGGGWGGAGFRVGEDLRPFTALMRREVVAVAGHNMPQESPDAVVASGVGVGVKGEVAVIELSSNCNRLDAGRA